MSKEKKIEKIIDTYKSMLSILVVSLFGMIAYLFVNVDSMSSLKIAILIGGIVLDCVAIGIGVWLYIRNLNELEKLE